MYEVTNMDNSFAYTWCTRNAHVREHLFAAVTEREGERERERLSLWKNKTMFQHNNTI